MRGACASISPALGYGEDGRHSGSFYRGGKKGVSRRGGTAQKKALLGRQERQFPDFFCSKHNPSTLIVPPCREPTLDAEGLSSFEIAVLFEPVGEGQEWPIVLV